MRLYLRQDRSDLVVGAELNFWSGKIDSEIEIENFLAEMIFLVSIDSQKRLVPVRTSSRNAGCRRRRRRRRRRCCRC